MRTSRDIRIGVAGLALYCLGLVTVVTSATMLASGVDHRFSFVPLGRDFFIPGVVAVAVLPVGVFSTLSGLALMLGRALRSGLIASLLWVTLGVIGWFSGAAPGLAILGLAMLGLEGAALSES